MKTLSYQKAKDKMAIRKPHISNNNPKCKWTELINKKAQKCRMDQKIKPNHMLPPGDTSQLQKQI